ncbi:hypothetical protein H4R18_004506 [Coemansia javaensis]|uniref:Uncharacterized protein n=1 Tax=Coemansia javaensis TaxID=2761396 RepID=A0A9W8H7K4_9FUNG|nr:hypothetical protein H4R18_004506 [Coemansia javaensis]
MRTTAVARLGAGRLADARGAAPYKLQMAAVSSRRGLLFVALRARVSVYAIAHRARPPVLRGRLERSAPGRASDEINAITLGCLHGVEILVAVYDSGQAVAWSLRDDFPVLWVWSGAASTWGCAISPASGAVATSANSRLIRVCSGGTPAPHRETMFLRGHGHNIPCVQFSPCGTYLASASIDQTVRVWALPGGRCVFAFAYTQWCCGVPESDGSGPSAAPPLLLLCSTAADLLLLDPASQESPVVDRIERVVSRSARPAWPETEPFDRVTFLEWIPKLGIAVAGSLSGTVAIVSLCAPAGGARTEARMHVLERIPEHAPASQLYGTAVYHHPEDTPQSAAAVLYLLFLDGEVMAYELRRSAAGAHIPI